MSDTFNVQFLSPTALKPYYRNHKQHSKDQVLKLAKAIRTMGFDQPIVVDRDHVIIKGHGRRMAALELKLDLVPVVVRDDLTPAQVQASRIADNYAHSLSKVDVAKEQAEIAGYIEMGGVDAGVFFDFAQPPPAALEVPGATSPTPKQTVSVAGKLLNCPRCHHTFMKTK